MAPKNTDKVSRPSLNRITTKDQQSYKSVCDDYKVFLNNVRTPREGVIEVAKRARQAGFKEWKEGVKTSFTQGFYMENIDGTNVAVVKLGKKPITDGVHIVGAHLDSPCLTAKVNPVREKPEGVMLDCYPYGGIYTHQWFDTAVTVIGHCVKGGKHILFELPGIVTDATIHLSYAERNKKSYDDAFDAESLDVFIGYKDKETFLKAMKKEYGIDENDFRRTMLIAVPRNAPYELSDLYYAGFGQDDKVCSFAQLHAVLKAKPQKTAITIFFDREEIGSTGYNGANSRFLEHVMDAVAQCAKEELSDVQLRRIFAKSQMISADVDVAYNSNDTPYSQEESASKFGDGIVMDRHNGGRNQSFGNNVPMVLVDKYMQLFDKHKIDFKVSAIPPKVNTGGGGTIAMYFAHRGIPVVDMGIPVTNMHGKYSVIFFPDLYQLTKGLKVFFESEL